MKFNNKKRIQNHKYFYGGLLVILIGTFFVIQDVPLLNTAYLLIKYNLLVFAFLLTVYALNGREYFEYDSTAQILIIKNDNIIKHGLFPERMMKVEFPKIKLSNYKIRNYLLYKSLNIYIHSKEKEIIKKNF
ncbi:MAG: hypothetical protein L3J45_02320 [Flavobacteriaceae bacterium]|nr:hypothetical protein [Flavobacteriaceae bacterium]